ncbi:DUF2516 family protein [Actinobacteria bacterium YIM 96077]|uniref:DUF2516 domain-containing protein n=1 Tax=Phytoactinopolyspora halophila TaxID=1981511 RepID=A0A329QP27_9ACTN|nr:DUF2516 family protein [Phytoactinopolyspora halophila]AYY14505.1 DUF2516 family protein [Actinobacteria bacterium YIM 96077]RAW14115.1 DUF2516 domain-containing protein [Phytoactinopolyspora halophila]
MDFFGDIQALLILGLAVGAVGLKGYALIDALRVRAEAFPAAGKLTKPIWLTFLVLALVTELAFFPMRVMILTIIGVVAAAVYLVDVRPAVRAMGGGRRGPGDGPYGSW